MAESAMRRRVVVTGIGVVTPLGSTIPIFWGNLVHGRSAARAITRFDASCFPTQFAAEVRDVGETGGPGEPTVCTLLDRKDRFGWVAATAALQDAQLPDSTSRHRIGIAVGTERRSPSFLDRIAAKSRYDKPSDHLRTSPFVVSSALAALHGFGGPHLIISSACASSSQAIGVAYQKIRWGEADAMVAGGCDSVVDPLSLSGFSRIGALSTDNANPSHASRPFDRRRDGFVLGEGAGMLVLEELRHATVRAAHIYGEVLGYGSSSNGYRITDSPADGEGAYRAMRLALEDARVQPETVDYINAHGTSTPQNDRSETAAIKRCFGPCARTIPISSTKSMIGHLVTASGAVQLIVCLLTIAHGVITPTINYEEPDPECDLDYVPNEARLSRVGIALSNAFGFGGVNAAVLVGRYHNE
jgi:3-oxoacyl-[acyl-carrier-protein] synthase II